jgi:hypothetical protein
MSATRLEMQNVANWGIIRLTVGSRNGAAGRYLMVIEGFRIDPAGDQDTLYARLGPLARSSTMTVYMIRAENMRIDPTLRLYNPDSEEEIVCDDVGRRGCEDIPPTAGLAIDLRDGVIVTGQRFDAGVQIATGSPDPVLMTFSSRTKTTHGLYYVVIVGELPARES